MDGERHEDSQPANRQPAFDISSTEVYERSAGTAGDLGRLYEAGIASLIHARASGLQDYRLAMNCDALHPFDDIVFWIKDPPTLICMQLKYKRNCYVEKKELLMENKGMFALPYYYKKIKDNKIEEANGGSTFYILYTNAELEQVNILKEYTPKNIVTNLLTSSPAGRIHHYAGQGNENKTLGQSFLVFSNQSQVTLLPHLLHQELTLPRELFSTDNFHWPQQCTAHGLLPNDVTLPVLWAMLWYNALDGKEIPVLNVNSGMWSVHKARRARQTSSPFGISFDKESNAFRQLQSHLQDTLSETPKSIVFTHFPGSTVQSRSCVLAQALKHVEDCRTAAVHVADLCDHLEQVNYCSTFQSANHIQKSKTEKKQNLQQMLDNSNFVRCNKRIKRQLNEEMQEEDLSVGIFFGENGLSQQEQEKLLSSPDNNKVLTHDKNIRCIEKQFESMNMQDNVSDHEENLPSNTDEALQNHKEGHPEPCKDSVSNSLIKTSENESSEENKTVQEGLSTDKGFVEDYADIENFQNYEFYDESQDYECSEYYEDPQEPWKEGSRSSILELWQHYKLVLIVDVEEGPTCKKVATELRRVLRSASDCGLILTASKTEALCEWKKLLECDDKPIADPTTFDIENAPVGTPSSLCASELVY